MKLCGKCLLPAIPGEEYCPVHAAVAKESPTAIPYNKKLIIRNLESLPRGTGARYLVAIEGQNGELVAKRWARVKPAKLGIIEVLIGFE